MHVLDRKPKGSRFSEIYTSRMATPSVQEQIKTQGEIVRQLKKDKAPNEKVNICMGSIPFHGVYEPAHVSGSPVLHKSHMEVT